MTSIRYTNPNPRTGTTPRGTLSPYMKALRKRQKEALAKRGEALASLKDYKAPKAKPKAKGKSGKDVDFSKGTTKSRILAAQLAKAKAAKKAGTTPESRGVKGSTLRERMLAKKIAAEKAKNPSRFKDSPVKATVTKPKVKPKTKKTTTQTPRQKAIAAVKARSAAKRAAILKQFNSLTPAQKTAMKQKQQAKALSFKQRQGTNQAKPTKTTGTLGYVTRGTPGELQIPNTQTAGVKPKPRTGIRPKIIKEKRQEVTKPKTGFNVTRPRPETTNPIRPRVSVGSKATKPDVKERPRRSVRRGSRLAEIRKRMLERATTTSPRRRSSSNRSQAPSRSNTSQRSSRSRFSRRGNR